MTTDDLIRFWGRLGGGTIHPDDAPILGMTKIFETRLIPLPWNGPILTSRVFVAMLNPSLDPKDVGYEANNTKFCRHLRQNLTGNAPYVYLEDDFQDHPGADWARKTFGTDHSIIRDANVCVLQLVPYHCAEGGIASKFAASLKSAAFMRTWVQRTLLPRVRSGDAILAVARAARAYDVENEAESRTFIRYSGSECRRGYMTKNVRGGVALRKFISDLKVLSGPMV